jgi:hypothetical protein
LSGTTSGLHTTFLTSEGASVLGSGLMISGLVAVAVYLGFWVIGWFCAGFTRDMNRPAT